MFAAHGKNGLTWNEKGSRGFVLANPDLANIWGGTDFDFESYIDSLPLLILFSLTIYLTTARTVGWPLVLIGFLTSQNMLAMYGYPLENPLSGRRRTRVSNNSPCCSANVVRRV